MFFTLKNIRPQLLQLMLNHADVAPFLKLDSNISWSLFFTDFFIGDNWRYPLKAVKVMHTVALRTESSLPVSIMPPVRFNAYKVIILQNWLHIIQGCLCYHVFLSHGNIDIWHWSNKSWFSWNNVPFLVLLS